MNAKELILKKINADTNWVDIYTSAFVLGEDLSTIGSFMISPEISELISKYSSSLFDPDASFETKIQFIEKNISEADTPAKKYAYTELLERVKIAEELRILGKILKINQGMPTNTADFYEYVSKIEYYIESRLNKQLIDKYNGIRNLTSEEWIGRKKYYDATVFPYKNAFKLLKLAIKKYGYPYEIEDLLNSDKTELKPELEKAVTTFEDTMRSLGYIGHSYWKDYKIVQEAYSEWYKDLGKVINELKENWKKFSIVRFVKDDDYAQTTISEYESRKVKFNILDVLKLLPHFNEMYKVLALNDRVLTVLSKRNEIESKVWQKAIHKYSNGNADILLATPNKSERKILKSLVDDALIQTWLTTGLTDFYLSAPDGTRVDFDGSLTISKLKSFIETSIIPRLRNNKFIINGQNIDTKSNEFVRRLTFGKHNGESIFKLPFNMSEIDSNPGIKQEYEKILQAFGELRNIHLEGGLTVVDVFYLYNLIVHKDHFGRNSLTRLFEDLISSKDGEKLLVFKFNEWLETVNEQEIVDKVLSSWGASHRNDLSPTGNSTQIYISTNPLNKSMLFYSGGANGSDSAWGMYLRQQGFTVKDYTVNDWRALSAEQKEYYEQLYQAAINLIGTEGWPADSYAGELTRRDMMQADSATSIFAIGTLSNSGKVNGGTKYATYAAIFQGKPVYLFNLNNNSWYWYDYNSSSFIRMNDKPNLISGAAVIGTRDDKSKTGAEALRASGHEAIKDIIDRSLKLSAPKTRTVKYTPKGQTEQTYTIIGTKIFNKDGGEVYSDENSGHRKLIFVELALQEKRAVKVEYRNVTYVVNDKNQIFSTSSNKIVYQNENDGNRRVILERAREEFAKLSNQSSPRVEIYQGYWTRAEVASQTDKVFLFGDNTEDRLITHHVPTRTQAVIRELSNAIGIDTKKNRGTSESSYFTDADFDSFKTQVDEAIQRAINSGKTIVIPADGIGTGKAELEKRAPKLFAYLQQRLDELKNLNSTSPVQFDDSIDISEEFVAEDPVTIGFANTDERVDNKFSDETLHIDSDYIAEREEILRNAPRNSEGKLLAPNGKVSKLTEEQWVTVRTKAFKKWFGDWINPYNENINISLDIDMESADTDGFGSRVAIILKDKNNPLQGEFIGSIPMQQQIKSIKYFKFTQYVDINSVAGSSYIEEEFRGKGFGKAAYWELGMWLSRNGSILRSAKDSSRTEAATRVWKSLEKDGFAKKIEDRYEFVNNSSKVIDENSEPLVVYHHTDNSNLTEFSTDFPNYFSQLKGGTKKAIFFDENTSGTLGRKYDIPVFLNIRNLTTYVGTKEDLHKKGTDYTTVVNESAARNARFGGLHMSKFDDNKLLNQDVWIIHDEHNVKSAIGAHEFTSSPNIYDADPTPVYQTTPSKQSKLIELVRQANEKGVKGIHIVSQSDLVNEDIYVRSAKGFVRNGEIYINIDRAGDDTVIHEFGHLYLAEAKVNNREKYYELLEKVRQTKLWSDMKTWKAYANKIGSDFDEEVLATMIGDYYKSEFGIDYEYTDLVKEALSLVDGGFIDLINSEILPDLGDTFITNYALSQRTATLKHKLVSDNILKENCL